jgi:23S rRNA (cytosine1962-C5)-methyltransferase
LSSDRYELIDFGDGRKLESLAGHVIDRPCPAAQGAKVVDPQRWTEAAARFDTQSRKWTHHRAWPPDLDIDCGTFRMPVRPTPYGHVGVFPEQAANWHWLGQPRPAETQPPLALNLFAYTGASTMALAMAGYHVAHVDAAKPNVQAARVAAEHNGMLDAPIRYLVDDAAKFAAREIRRGRKYHTIVLDPPAYGHSPLGKAWRLERDLQPLLENCLELLDPTAFRLLITGHSADVRQSDVTEFLGQSGFLGRAEAACGLLIDSGRSQLNDKTGRSLDAGFYVRVQSRPL